MQVPVSKKRIFITITSIVVGFIVLHIMGALRGVEQAMRRIISPVSAGIYDISVSLGNNQSDVFESPEALKQGYEELYQLYLDAKVDEAQLEMLQHDNAQLQETLQFYTTSTYSYQYVGASVIGKNIEPLSRTIILNKGSDAGIADGDAVIVRGGMLVGTVMRTNAHTAVVRLINDNQSTIAATILNRERSIGLIEGGFGLSVDMNFIPQNEVISVGDTIVTSGLNDHIPRGLVIGVVDSVEKEAYQPFQEAVVRPLVNLDKIDLVSVITGELYVEEITDSE